MAASVYGLVLVLPLYGTEWMLMRSGRPLYGHPEFLYGFVGTTACMQLVYWTIGRDPVRFRPFMPIVAAAKTSFFLPIMMLWVVGRTAGSVAFFACIDGLLAVLFGCSWWITAPAAQPHLRSDGERA